MESNVLTRQELYDLVWSTPSQFICRRFGISNHFFYKTCEEMVIPLPGYWYWENVKNGKFEKRKELPTDYKGKEEILFSWEADPFSPVAKERDILNDKSINLVVPHILTNPDPLVVEARDSLNRKDDYRRSRERIETESGKLAIRVGKEHIHRALLLMDTLIKALRGRGHSFSYESSQIVVVILGVSMGFGLKEHRDRVETTDRYSSFDLKPTGRLYFDIGTTYPQVVCMDTTVKLESKLHKIIRALELYAEDIRRCRDENQHREDERKEQERIRQVRQARKQRELDDFKNLLAKSERRFQTEIIRHFIDLVEKKEKENHTIDEEKREWIHWARGKADWYDPFIESDDELLQGADRKTLSF